METATAGRATIVVWHARRIAVEWDGGAELGFAEGETDTALHDWLAGARDTTDAGEAVVRAEVGWWHRGTTQFAPEVYGPFETEAEAWTAALEGEGPETVERHAASIPEAVLRRERSQHRAAGDDAPPTPEGAMTAAAVRSALGGTAWDAEAVMWARRAREEGGAREVVVDAWVEHGAVVCVHAQAGSGEAALAPVDVVRAMLRAAETDAVVALDAETETRRAVVRAGPCPGRAHPGAVLEIGG